MQQFGDSAAPTYAPERRQANFLSGCGLLGLVGVLAAVITDLLAAILVDGYSIISQSISALAVGHYAWIQDAGLYLLSLGTIAVAVGLARWRFLEGTGLLTAAFLLSLLGTDLVIIAYFNEYAGQENQGANVHINAVYALGILFAACTLLFAFSVRASAKNWASLSALLGGLWILLAPFFFYVPSSWFGLYERTLGLILVCWIGVAAWLLRRRAAALRQATAAASSS
ncbi:MAG TPA: DUF998 domain-containing protein [Devosiaceae bacterium]|jgi:hypothetical protein|nr:DUF998 domain-containing protein [Devosiaceae bacterium]